VKYLAVRQLLLEMHLLYRLDVPLLRATDVSWGEHSASSFRVNLGYWWYFTSCRKSWGTRLLRIMVDGTRDCAPDIITIVRLNIWRLTATIWVVPHS